MDYIRQKYHQIINSNLIMTFIIATLFLVCLTLSAVGSQYIKKCENFKDVTDPASSCYIPEKDPNYKKPSDVMAGDPRRVQLQFKNTTPGQVVTKAVMKPEDSMYYIPETKNYINLKTEIELETEKELEMQKDKEVGLQKEKEDGLQKEKEDGLLKENEMRRQAQKEIDLLAENGIKLPNEKEFEIQAENEVELNNQTAAEMQKDNEFKPTISYEVKAENELSLQIENDTMKINETAYKLENNTILSTLLYELLNTEFYANYTVLDNQ